ncbi:LacI family DNA-binding transcriptional regulator [Georgenia phoenicis]|uniref:LacI family DNA-binding transcriptional regulator n=1 Tax=unclassified Georgenia TaxID=2626815 RepID=UPI0039B10FDF
MSTPRRRVTVHDVAREARVSRGTVSRVVNGERYVSTEARKAVEAAILRTGYVPSRAARTLVRQRAQAVGFVVHEPHAMFVDDPNIGRLLLGANRALSAADHQMPTLIFDSDEDSQRIVRYLGGGVVDGVILVSAREHDPITDAVRNLGLATAFIGNPRNEMPWVGIDNEDAAHSITSRLLETGRRKVGMIAAGMDRDSGSDRYAGFRRALGDRFDEGLVVRVDHYSFADGVTGMRELLARCPDVDGVFAASDALAAGAIDTLNEAGRRVPQDVGIVGFDDSGWAQRCRPQLSTVRQPAEALGAAAAALVLAQLEGRPVVSGSLLETPVVWRDSA